MRIGKYANHDGGGAGWLVKPLIGFDHNALIVGSKGSGKSFFSWFIARAVAKGEPVMGFETLKMPVLLIDEETPEGDFIERAKHVFGDEDLDIHTFPRPEEHGFNFGNEQWIKRLENRLTALNTQKALLIIDNVNATQGSLGIEESAVAVGRLRQILVRLRQVIPGLTVILISHTGKDESRGTRGSSAQEDMADTILRLKRVWDTPFRFGVEQVPRKRPAYLKPFLVELYTSGEQWELNYLGEEENIELPTEEDKIIFEHFKVVVGSDSHTVKKVYGDLGERIGINSIRDSLARLHKQSVLTLGKEAHNLHRFSLASPLPQTHFVAALVGESAEAGKASDVDTSQKNCDSRETRGTAQSTSIGKLDEDNQNKEEN